jgi:hypothetical protein
VVDNKTQKIFYQSKNFGCAQGCQIFLGPNIPNWEKIQLMTINFTK